MAKTYSDYTLHEIANKRQLLFNDLESVESSDWLKNSLVGTPEELAKCEGSFTGGIGGKLS